MSDSSPRTVVTQTASASDQSDDYPGYDSDFHDLGLIDIWSDESDNITEILTLKNTTRDKIAYTIFSANIFLTCFLTGYCPNFFYIWHTWKAFILIPYRWYTYKKQLYHYFLFDFCYFTNLLVLLYIWMPEQILGPYYRGMLFTTCFSFANGPLLSAIVLWRNSLVPHSSDKMTSLFIHVSPSISTWGIRWFSTDEQGFPLCSYYHETSDCSNVGVMEIMCYPLIMYFLWQVLYILMVEIIGKERVEQKNYTTSYTYIVEKSRNSSLVKLFNIFGPRYRKLMYIASQLIFTLVSSILAYFCYFYKEVNMVVVCLVMAVASYNGASFYIDVFCHKYAKSKSN